MTDLKKLYRNNPIIIKEIKEIQQFLQQEKDGENKKVVPTYSHELSKKLHSCFGGKEWIKELSKIEN